MGGFKIINERHEVLFECEGGDEEELFNPEAIDNVYELTYFRNRVDYYVELREDVRSYFKRKRRRVL